ncbi:hypothetical protein SDRG_15632 [Saprolegnia diclina VS20]|uniref:RRM domain-containing protein n=1 Tax=Saprolegnia diclina (strain VS20) TaxID=1156394 RepID=T0PZM6_SAPDV|nr:hypothetical protein SDRG_15632 [Saprolegnia diclina VS20]EQC26540.1 hypothetical protein SDRG_15632 [Saprolegnia diclina VS20]|eukprot:XP_008620033.1 hypothetical protein SDRG_15632 [Saprolegnia diclina VS20]
MPYAGEKRDGETHEMKRLRHEENQVASRVVFARGLPDDCLESELMALCMPFSSVEKVLMIPDKNQAFVELPDTTAATNLIAFYQAHDAMVRGKKVFFAFSSRGEICPQKGAAKGFKESPRRRSPPRSTRRSPPRTADPRGYQPTPTTYETTPTNLYLPPGQRNKILMVTISNLEYEVKVDTLHQVFSGYGSVVKIVLFFKGPELKALIEMETIEQAEAAQHALNGRDIYTGCNTLHIGISNHATLTVRFNNDTCRDYTNPTLPAGPANQAPEPWMLDEPVAPARTEFVPPTSLPPPTARGRDRRSRSRSRDRRPPVPEPRRPRDRRDLSPRAPSPRRFESRAPSPRRLDSRPARDFDARPREYETRAPRDYDARAPPREYDLRGPPPRDGDLRGAGYDPRELPRDYESRARDVAARPREFEPRREFDTRPREYETRREFEPRREYEPRPREYDARGLPLRDLDVRGPSRDAYDVRGRDLDPRGPPPRDYDARHRDMDPRGRDMDPRGRDMDPRGRDMDPRGRDMDLRGRDADFRSRDMDARGRDADLRGRDVDPRGRDVDFRGRALDRGPPARSLERGSRSNSSFDPRSVVREVDERQPPRLSGSRGPPPRPPPSKGRDFPPRDGRFEVPSSCVLICSNIDDHYMKMPALFTIFGCFGDVMRLKIMYRKQGTILVQFVDEVHAQSAREHLDGLHVCCKKWRVDYSKHASVVMPRADAEPFELQNTIDFSKALSHRYRRRSLAEVAPPSPMLHISGIPDSMQPATLAGPHPIADLCSQHGILRQFHPILKQPKMALLEMETLEDALDTMVALDNVLFADGRIRVSFSKSSPRP